METRQNSIRTDEPQHYSVDASQSESVGKPENERNPLALIVYHGMGQQLPFETADLAVAALEQGARGHATIESVHVRQVTLGDQPLTRSEVTIKPKGADSVRVDIYECYWAPLTEGQITLKETAEFLIDAGRRGVGFSLSRSPFRRWMFGGMQELVAATPVGALWFTLLLLLTALFFVTVIVPFNMAPRFLCAAVAAEVLGIYALLTVCLRRTTRYLLFALLVVLSLLEINATIVAITTTLTLHGGISVNYAHKDVWPTPATLNKLTVDLACGLILLALFAFLGILLPNAIQHFCPEFKGGLWRILFRIATGSMLATIVITAVMVIYHCFIAPSMPFHTHEPYFVTVSLKWLRGCIRTSNNAGYAAIWLIALAMSRLASQFLLQYLGDVAIYVSAHRLNRFADVRAKIRNTASDVTCAVYSALSAIEPKDSSYMYREILVVGHSLGSVIAYDALNAAVIQDKLLGGKWRVAERTRLLLTFGSPLDKTAFLFRSQGEADGTDVREAMASSIQPLITEDRDRPDYWVNIWSPDDWISGDINFYDPEVKHSQRLNKNKHVRNQQDPQAITPLASHTTYWTNQLMSQILYAAVTAPNKDALGGMLPGPGQNDPPPRWAIQRYQQYQHIQRQRNQAATATPP